MNSTVRIPQSLFKSKENPCIIRLFLLLLMIFLLISLKDFTIRKSAKGRNKKLLITFLIRVCVSQKLFYLAICARADLIFTHAYLSQSDAVLRKYEFRDFRETILGPVPPYGRRRMSTL